jgi:hypothetical protein
VATTAQAAGAGGGFVESCPQTSQNRASPSSASRQTGQWRATDGADGGDGGDVMGTPHSSQ